MNAEDNEYATVTNNTSPSTSNSVENINISANEYGETAEWVDYLPKSFGIQDTIRASSYRWCGRESAMWGIASGTAMSMHRIRMSSRAMTAVNAWFLTFFVVSFPSYYFCVRRRDHKEHMIGLMMKLNSFDHAINLPPEPPLENHPFLQPEDGTGENVVGDKEYRKYEKEKKEWEPKKSSKESMGDFFSE